MRSLARNASNQLAFLRSIDEVMSGKPYFKQFLRETDKPAQDSFLLDNTIDLRQGLYLNRMTASEALSEIQAYVTKLSALTDNTTAMQFGKALQRYIDNPAVVEGIIKGTDDYLRHSSRNSQETTIKRIGYFAEVFNKSKTQGQVGIMIGAMASTNNSIDKLFDGGFGNMLLDTAIKRNFSGLTEHVLLSDRSISHSVERFGFVINKVYSVAYDVYAYYKKFFPAAEMPYPLIVVHQFIDRTAGVYRPRTISLYINATGIEIEQTVAHEIYHGIEDAHQRLLFRDREIETDRYSPLKFAFYEGGATFAESAYLSYKHHSKNNTVLRNLGNSMIRALNITSQYTDFYYESDAIKQRAIRGEISDLYSKIKNSGLNTVINHINSSVLFETEDYRQDRYVIGTSIAMLLFAYNGFNVKRTLKDMTKSPEAILKKLKDKIDTDSTGKPFNKMLGGIYEKE